MEIEFGIRTLRRLAPFEWEQARFAIGEMETLGIEQRLIAAVRVHWPLQSLVAFQPLVVHASEHRGHRGDFIHDLRWMPVAPAGSQPVRYILNDDPVGTAALNRL